MAKNYITDNQEGIKELNLLYDLGLRKFNGGKRLTDKKEKIFLQIWQNYDISYEKIARELHITHGTVRNYASDIFKKVGYVIGEKLTQNTLKSSVICFLDKSPETSDFKGSLTRQYSVKDSLRKTMKEAIQKCLEEGLDRGDISDCIDDIRNNINSPNDT